MSPGDWFGVRCLFRTIEAPGSGRGHVYEERVTLWRASSFDEAIERAEAEAESYARDTESDYAGLAQAFALAGPPMEGAEVFLLMRDSDLSPEAYLTRFFDTGSERQQS